MPIVPFASLPDSARVWIFASDHPLTGAAADSLLATVDRFLADWKAHGVPLRCAREWREDRFLAVGVDVEAERASGCSIDGLYRALQQVEREVGSHLVGGGRVFYRTKSGVKSASRDAFSDRVKSGDVAPETPIFDTSITGMSEWRTRFERPAVDSWTASLFRD